MDSTSTRFHVKKCERHFDDDAGGSATTCYYDLLDTKGVEDGDEGCHVTRGVDYQKMIDLCALMNLWSSVSQATRRRFLKWQSEQVG